MLQKYLTLFILVMTFSLIRAQSHNKEELQFFLEPTKNINSHHPEIIRKAHELTGLYDTHSEKAKILYEFVRDTYNDNSSRSFKASDILEYGGNNCICRSILLVALCRAVGIPARLHMMEFMVKDYVMEDGRVMDMRSPHVVTGIYLNDTWRLYEATGNAKKWIALTQDEQCALEMPVPFSPDRDCLFPSNNKIRFTNGLLYFADWSQTAEYLKEEIHQGKAGFLFNQTGGTYEYKE